MRVVLTFFFFFQAEDGIRDSSVTGVQTCALPIYSGLTLNNVVNFAGGRWTVVGIFDAGGSAFDSEVWCDSHVRSEERRVGKEGRSRWSPYHLKKKKDEREQDSSI